MTGYHRLNLRYERKGIHFCAFLTLAAALTCRHSQSTIATTTLSAAPGRCRTGAPSGIRAARQRSWSAVQYSGSM
ncbi:hypothetical protein ACFZC5_34725 [Nocardia gamkensis]|uniref:hypothetical protein n=1 Tax=Nocardia gamkensis TaxID=352869 RepID=UPI0036ED9818